MARLTAARWRMLIKQSVDKAVAQAFRESADRLERGVGIDGRPLAPQTDFSVAMKREQKLSTQLGKRRGGMLRMLRSGRAKITITVSARGVMIVAEPIAPRGSTGGRLSLLDRLSQFERGIDRRIRSVHESRFLRWKNRTMGYPAPPGTFGVGGRIRQPPRPFMDWTPKTLAPIADRLLREAVDFWGK